jgi:glycosyltransferase involved in cell wall biosynthesis
MKNLKIFIWQSSIEHHEYYTWLSLISLLEDKSEITFVVGQVENDIRKAQGWKAVDFSKFKIRFIPSARLWRDGRKIINENSGAIHVFLGFRGTKKGYSYFPLILYSLLNKIKVAVINEPYSIGPEGYFNDKYPALDAMKVFVRPILYRCMALFINICSVSRKPCIFPISMIAKDQFISTGFDAESMFPFGWFVPNFNQCKPIIPKGRGKILNIVYVGASNKRKGVDILVAALNLVRFEGFDVRLDLYGGDELKKYCESSQWFCYKGLLPFEVVQSTIQNYDILVLPSRHDGWGVVVNEALLQGVPVIASSRVGAKQLLEASGAGLIFESENEKDLADTIKKIIDKPEMLETLQEKAFQVGSLISPENGAQYFLDVLNYYFFQSGSRPSVIWSKDLSEE